ncbi:hypothetical protein [Sulfitobacter sediminilitoris]|uniref:hypothetical protein n=1 Tax=Sulfitobacter sediminilitoris TaxID=2698830 RepID=UPI0036196598
MKNSKNPHSRFSAKTLCIGKAGTVRTERAFRAAHIAKALIWPTPPRQDFQLALYGEVFHRFLEKTEFFNTISPLQTYLNRAEQIDHCPSIPRNS